MTDPTVTAERLRQLADLFVERARVFSRHALNADEAGNEYEAQIILVASAYWEADAAALRAAADQIAAREALLRKAMEALEPLRKTAEDALYYCADDAPVEHEVYVELGAMTLGQLRDVRALAAEIADALNNKEHDQ